MELIRIRDDRLKIMLTESDMDKYSLSCESLDYDNAETRHALWSILGEAKRKTGFDAASSRVLVQVYTSKCGGCEMYVTKLSEDAEENDSNCSSRRYDVGCGVSSVSQDDPGNHSRQDGSDNLGTRGEEFGLVSCSEEKAECFGIWEFCGSENLIRACRLLKELECNVRGIAYSDRCGRYFLEIQGFGAQGASSGQRFYIRSLLGEYAERSLAESVGCVGRGGRHSRSDLLPVARAYIYEHCAVISENAVSELSALCVK